MLVGHCSVCLPQLLDEADVMAHQARVAQRQKQHVPMKVPEQRMCPAGLLCQRVEQEKIKAPVQRRFSAEEADDLQQVGHCSQGTQRKWPKRAPLREVVALRSGRFREPEQQEPDQKPQGEVPCPFKTCGFCDHESAWGCRSGKHLSFAERQALAVFD